MDFDNKAANMAWMHIHKNEAMIGGSIAQPKDTLGPYVAAFCDLYIHTGSDAEYKPTKVIEVYNDGTERSSMLIPAPDPDWTSGSYRAVPYRSVGDESKLDGYRGVYWPPR